MQLVSYFKMPFRNKFFRKNQKVWIQQMTGNQAAKVAGRYRGKYQYISGWVSWRSNKKENPNIKKTNIDTDFVLRHCLELDNAN